MKTDPAVIRPLHPIEEAFTFSNERLPLSVVCVLHLRSAPETDTLKEALATLQTRHRLLQCGIRKTGGRYVFHLLDPVPAIPLLEEKSTEAGPWQRSAREALNTPFPTSGPLMRCWLVRSKEEAASALILNFHHAVIDGVSARLLLHELLSLYAGLKLPLIAPSSGLHQFPAPYSGGPAWWKKQLNFLLRRIPAEWRHRRAGIARPIPAHSENGLISLRLPSALSRRLAVRAGREGLALNSVLLAAMTTAWLQHRPPESMARYARVLSFANLREAMEPPVAPTELGCYISMLQLMVDVQPEESTWKLAHKIRKALFQAGRRGDHLLMSLLSRQLVALAFRIRSVRLGLCALSFIGKLDLQPQYGQITLQDVNAFITNNQYGPEWSAFGKTLFGAIGLDFNYLTAETSHEEATEIVETIRLTLEKMAK